MFHYSESIEGDRSGARGFLWNQIGGARADAALPILNADAVNLLLMILSLSSISKSVGSSLLRILGFVFVQ